MAKHAIVPPHLRAAAEELKMSPAILQGDHRFLIGSAGGDPYRQMPAGMRDHASPHAGQREINQ